MNSERYTKAIDPNNPYWQEVQEAVRKRVAKRYGKLRCEDNGSTHHGPRTVAHLNYDHLGRELDHLNDLVYLCWHCHQLLDRGHCVECDAECVSLPPEPPQLQPNELVTIWNTGETEPCYVGP